jgi:Tfp pilus assembly protein PilW
MRFTWHVPAAAAAAALTMLAAGCGASPAPASTPASPVAVAASSGPVSPVAASTAPAAAPDSCSVITQAEAASALGQPVQPPIRGKAVVEGGVACVFYGPEVPPGTSPNIAVADSVRVVLVTGPKARKYFDNYRSKVHAVPISGLGDQAYYDGYASISVLKGDAYVRIAVGIPDNLGVEKTLAADALPRM